jgi:hypothetical protein
MSATRNPNLAPSQMRIRRRRQFFIRLYIILFFLAVIVLGLAIFSGYKKVVIQIIIISGNAAVTSDDVLAIVNQDISGRYFYLFSRSNSMIFPRSRIRADLLEQNKTIKDLDISWDNWQQISIILTERKPHSVWCGKDILNPAPTCYFMDRDGYVYKETGFTGTIFVKNYGPLTGGQISSKSESPVGSYFLSKQMYLHIFSLIDKLSEYGLRVSAVSFDETDFKFVLEIGPTIIFNDEASFDTSFSNLLVALETKNLDLINEAKTINYIDLRYDSKIVIGRKK